MSIDYWCFAVVFRLYIQHVIQEVIKANRKCDRKDRTGYQATNYMAMPICVVAKYTQMLRIMFFYLENYSV